MHCPIAIASTAAVKEHPMSMFRNFKQIVSALFLVALTVQLSQAAATIVVEQSGVINGSGMDGVAGIDLTITYDTTILASPTVTKGSLVSKSFFTTNTASTGIIRIAIISNPPDTSFSGNGQIAIISFASKTGENGIKSIPVHSIIDIKGASMPLQAFVGAPTTGSSITPTTNDPPVSTTITTPDISSSSTPASTSNSDSTSTSSSTSSSTTTPASTTGYGGTVTVQTDTLQTKPEPQPTDTPNPISDEAAPQQQTEPVDAAPLPTASAGKAVVESKTEETGQHMIFKSVADRFKTYMGDKSLTIMTALFSKEVSKFIHQEPAVVISDGKSRVRIVVDLPASNATSPNFAMDNATVLSVKKDGKDNRRWIIEAIPEVHAWKATLNIIAGVDSFEFPLTVAPPFGNALKPDQTGWNALMKEAGSSQKLLYDFNNDGVHDYIDEFIFVANHLARK